MIRYLALEEISFSNIVSRGMACEEERQKYLLRPKSLWNDVLDTIARKLNLTLERKKYICNPIALQRGPNNVCERTLQNFLAGKFRFPIAPLWYFQLYCNPSDLDKVGPLSLHWWLVHTCWGPRFQQRWGTSWRSGWWRRQRCRRPGGSELRTEL